MTTVGSGRHVYEWIENWARPPKGARFGYTHGVCVDRQGRVYIHNQSEHAMMVFDPEGLCVKTWGREFAAGAHGLTLGEEGGEEFLYLSDIERRIVVKTTLDGDEVWRIGAPAESGAYADGKPFVPTNAAVAPNGDVYVADGYGSSYIHRFDADARYIQTWGGPGGENGGLDCPHGIAIDGRDGAPNVLVADRGNARLQYFTLDGKYLSTVDNDLRHPCHFDIRDGELLVPDLFGRVTVFDRFNRLVVHLGGEPEWKEPEGWPNVPPDRLAPGRFNSPHSACWDADGNIFVAEWIEYGRVVKLRKTG